MPRRARIVVPGWAHYIMQRGNRRQDVFHSDSQRRRYLQLLEQYASARGLVIRAYCSRDMGRQEQRAEWSRWLAASEDETTLARLRHCTRTGRAAGDDAALCDLEGKLGLRIRALPSGRPKKNQSDGKGGEINGWRPYFPQRTSIIHLFPPISAYFRLGSRTVLIAGPSLVVT